MQNTRLYLQLLSIHGLIRGENPEFGRDADTGGQVKYVLERLRGKPRIRFSPASNATGIIDGLHHYGLLDE